MKTYVIYCYTNTTNNKKYIGQSCDAKRRCHPSNYKGCNKFYNAIQKYGIEQFTFDILESGLTLEEANQKEEYYINIYNTVANGYNIKSGGLNNLYSEESKKKMSESCHSKRKILCIETQRQYESAMTIERELGYANTNIIACCQGKLITAYGYHWQYAEEERAVRKDLRKRSVFCSELNQIFESAAEASRVTQIARPNITKCCQHILKTAGGYHWQYAEDSNGFIN